jgi:hypothetical protein
MAKMHDDHDGLVPNLEKKMVMESNPMELKAKV